MSYQLFMVGIEPIYEDLSLEEAYLALGDWLGKEKEFKKKLDDNHGEVKRSIDGIGHYFDLKFKCPNYYTGYFPFKGKIWAIKAVCIDNDSKSEFLAYFPGEELSLHNFLFKINDDGEHSLERAIEKLVEKQLPLMEG